MECDFLHYSLAPMQQEVELTPPTAASAGFTWLMLSQSKCLWANHFPVKKGISANCQLLSKSALATLACSSIVRSCLQPHKCSCKKFSPELKWPLFGTYTGWFPGWHSPDLSPESIQFMFYSSALLWVWMDRWVSTMGIFYMRVSKSGQMPLIPSLGREAGRRVGYIVSWLISVDLNKHHDQGYL